MSEAAVVVLVLGAGTYVLKAAGPLALASRPIPRWLASVSELAPPALLAALIVTSAIVTEGRLTVDARLAGLVAAAVALRFRTPFIVMVVIAAATTAAVRAI